MLLSVAPRLAKPSSKLLLSTAKPRNTEFVASCRPKVPLTQRQKSQKLLLTCFRSRRSAYGEGVYPILTRKTSAQCSSFLRLFSLFA